MAIGPKTLGQVFAADSCHRRYQSGPDQKSEVFDKVASVEEMEKEIPIP